MAKQRTYRIRNWNQYNRSLINRGSITIWFSDDAKEKWLASKTGRKGRPEIYSDDAIRCALMIKFVYHLSLRATQGFLTSLSALLGIMLPIPCYTQVCRRASKLGQEAQQLTGNKKVTDIIVDSSGLKVFGEGEWKVRQHGKSKRRTWRKIHLAICAESQEVVISVITENKIADSEALEKMIPFLPPSVKRTFTDGAYDKGNCYRSLYMNGISSIIPPQKGAVLHDLSKEPWFQDRNDALRLIAGLGGDAEARSLWKKLMRYHQRSLVETAMFRFKTLFGSSLSARELKNQKAEVLVKSLALNRMTSLGMPRGIWEDI